MGASVKKAEATCKFQSMIMWREIRKQWKAPFTRQRELIKLGIIKGLIGLTASYIGDRYQFVALKTYLSRAISRD